MGEFGSLLQLGFGIGIGLSLFRAPMDLRANALMSGIADALKLLAKARTPEAAAKRLSLLDLRVKFHQERRKLDAWNRPIMIALIAGAAANLVALIWASVRAQDQIGIWWQLTLIFISVGYYVLALALLEVLARRHFSSVAADLKQIRGH
jgi:hypothetical protein